MAKQEILQVKVRMPKAFYRKIQRDADRAGQTINAEILQRLQQSYDTDAMLKEVSDRLAATHAEVSKKSEEIKNLILERYWPDFEAAYEEAQRDWAMEQDDDMRKADKEPKP